MSTRVILTAVVVALIVLALLASFYLKADQQQERTPKFAKKPEGTLSTIVVQFPGNDVTIGPAEIKNMTPEELANYGTLVSMVERFHATQEETFYLGYRLLPRFFKLKEDPKEDVSTIPEPPQEGEKK